MGYQYIFIADQRVEMMKEDALIDAMVKANKKFESAYYPNKNHGIAGGTTRLHLYTKMTDFIFNNL